MDLKNEKYLRPEEVYASFFTNVYVCFNPKKTYAIFFCQVYLYAIVDFL